MLKFSTDPTIRSRLVTASVEVSEEDGSLELWVSFSAGFGGGGSTNGARILSISEAGVLRLLPIPIPLAEQMEKAGFSLVNVGRSASKQVEVRVDADGRPIAFFGPAEDSAEKGGE